MSEKKFKVLLVTGGGFHPFDLCGSILKETYEHRGLAECTLVNRDEAFNKDISGYDAVAIYTQGGKLNPEQEKNLISFVKNGGGVVGFHCASDTFKDNAEYLSMIGSKFIGHGPGTPDFPVKVSSAAHPLSVRLPDFHITDEFYILEQQDKNLDIFLTSSWQGKQQPMAYTKEYGKGKVFYTALGHDERAFRNPSFKKLAIRGLLYVTKNWKKEGSHIGVGLLGYGGAFNMGKYHSDSMLLAGGFKPVAACDIDPSRLKQAQTEIPGIKIYSDLEKMLEDKNVDIVVVILPHNLHFNAAMKVMKAGKGAVIEKPFCIKSEEADELIEVSRENKVLLTVYQNRRWDHQFLTAKKLVETGAVGDVFETQIDIGVFGYPGNWWRSDKEIAGGLLYDWGSHCIDWMLHIIRDKVVSVSGYSQKRVWHMVTCEDHFRVIMRFRNGGVANFSNSTIYAIPNPGWRIIGTKGTIHFPTIFDEQADLYT
ncbi:MAG: ThuA domain-containing protein, partial [Candidatus Omnitrophica bacterium]|nr:ThuA domain-containing protein [Candidatus Omnitrophota bacterium]